MGPGFPGSSPSLNGNCRPGNGEIPSFQTSWSFHELFFAKPLEISRAICPE
jgi:hypothetical protein